MANELVVRVIDLLEHHRVSALIRMTLESSSSERFLYHLHNKFIRVK